MFEYYLKVLKNYATFTGRARRKEYWMFVLCNMLIVFGWMILGGILSVVTSSTGIMMFFTVLMYIYALAILIPSIAVVVRRLHDTNRSGWFYFIAFIPLIGGIWLLVLMCTDGDYKENQYGPDPKAVK